MDGGARWATVHGVAKSRTRLSDFTFTDLGLDGLHRIVIFYVIRTNDYVKQKLLKRNVTCITNVLFFTDYN